MSELILADIPEDVAERLRRRAERTGRTVEAEALDILAGAHIPLPSPRSNEPFGTALAQRLAEIGLTQDDWDLLNNSLEAVRYSRGDSIHRWVDFSDWTEDP